MRKKLERADRLCSRTMNTARPSVVVCDALTPHDCYCVLDSWWGPMLRAMHARADVEVPSSLAQYQATLAKKPFAVILTDSDLLKKPKACAMTVEYVRAGGRLVICGPFCSNVSPPDLDRFFSSFGLSWRMGDYHRTNFVLAPNFEDHELLSPRYSMKAVHVADAPPAARVYVPEDGARLQSHVFPSDPINDKGHAAVVLEHVGDGAVGWVGDVNAEHGSTPAVLFLAGLLLADPPRSSPSSTDFATFQIRWAPEKLVPDGIEPRTVALGRGGKSNDWYLLAVSDAGVASPVLRLSVPSRGGDDGSALSHSGGEQFACVHDMPLLFRELSRVGISDPGNGGSIGPAGRFSYREVLVPPTQRVHWCAGCAKWERLGEPRFQSCSACKTVCYCSTEVRVQSF